MIYYSLLTTTRKSQLAIEYGYRVRFESPATWVFWVHASNEARFEQGFRDIANQVKVLGCQDPKVNIFGLVENWLGDDKRGKWLLILDNVDDNQLLCPFSVAKNEDQKNSRTDTLTKPLWEYIPKSRNGSVIITSRTKEVALKIVDHKDLIEVKPMEQSEALELLQKNLDQPDESQEGQQLVNALELMPLAIVQAASYIQNRAPRCSVSKYLKDFQGSDRKATALLIQEADHSSRDWEAKNSILITWQLSIDYIRQSKPSAAGLLSLMSFFDRQGIPENLIRHQPKASYNSDPELPDDPSDGGISEYDADSEFEDDIRMLRDYSFISISKNSTSFRMSRLVQLTTRAWLKSYGEIDQWRERFISNLYQEFPISPYENWGKCRSLFPHVRSAMSQRPKSRDSLFKWATLLYRGAWYASQSGSVANTRDMAAKSREQRVILLGPEHEEALDSLAMLAIAYRLEGRWEEAERLEVQVLETRKMKLGADHPDTLTGMANLASTYRNQGRWVEAERLEVQVLETRRQTPGLEDLHTLGFSSEAAVRNRHVGSVDSDSSIENDSVFSAPVSMPSTRSLDSAREEMNSLLIQEFANLLNEDGVIFSLLLIGVSKDSVGFERMRNNFRRLLKHFANNLKAEILSESHQDLRRFISSYSAMITRELFAMVPIDDQPNIKPHDFKTENGITSVEKRLADERKVESYLQSLHRSGPAPQTSEVIQVLDPDDEESDQDSVAEEAGEDDPYEGNLQNLDQMKHFILESTAYQILYRRLVDFIEPSLNSRFRDLVSRWSNPEHKNHADAARYKLRNLATELQHVSPRGIQFERDENSSRFFRFMSHCQYLIERWTGEPWDWWPLPHCLRPLAESETRLRWECVSL